MVWYSHLFQNFPQFIYLSSYIVIIHKTWGREPQNTILDNLPSPHTEKHRKVSKPTKEMDWGNSESFFDEGMMTWHVLLFLFHVHVCKVTCCQPANPHTALFVFFLFIPSFPLPFCLVYFPTVYPLPP